MPEILEKCLSISNGSLFYRGDLHIHSHEASHDVSDGGMTPRAIVETAVRENLKIIAIADHNEISNVAEAIIVGEELSVLVIPAVELSTPEGHLLCYFPTIESLTTFHGRLELADRGTANSRCRTAMFACLELTKALGGFAVLAHVDGGNGLETNMPGGSPHKVDIICHSALLGIELKNSASLVKYSTEDGDQVRAHIGKQRIERLGLGERQYLARVLSSDSHTLNALGRNAIQDRKLTRYKMATPTFDGLKMAFMESDSRIRLEDDIPTTTPFVLGVSMDGGYLKGQAIHFSKNLNCIIGGRGTGKSTTFEAVRCLTGTHSGADVVDSEVWPQQLNLIWQDEAGQQHIISRPICGELSNLNDPLDGPIAFSIDCFGQGEAGRVREQAKSDPLALMKYLDTFTAVSQAIEDENKKLEELKELRREIVSAQKNVSSIPAAQRALNVLQQQLQAFESAKGTEVIKLQRSLSNEKTTRETMKSKLSELQIELANLTIGLGTQEIKDLASNENISIGKPESEEILRSLESFNNDFEEAFNSIETSFEAFSLSVKGAISRWAAKEQPILNDIEEKRKALEGQGVKLDMAHIKQLTSGEANQKKELENLRTWEPHLKDLRKRYSETLSQRWTARSKISSLRQAYAHKASRALAEVLSDLQVKLQYFESAFSDEAVSIIASAMGWRTVNYAKARLLVEKFTIPGLLSKAEKGLVQDFFNFKDDDNERIFSLSEAKEIIERLRADEVYASLELCHVDDLPRLIVTKRVDGDGAPRYVKKDFSQLSLGQQQSVLLALILSSDSKRPLIIDQPEDNLDSEFIFHTFVPVLRRAKERRQVIIVTHNANIAVLGDAEQLVVFKSNSEYSKIVARGSIDDPEARDSACKILEGAREAFTRRARIYGIG
jgi:DNA repair ATPase RecN